MAHLQSSSNDSWLISITSNPRRGYKSLGLCACLVYVLLSLTWLRDYGKPTKEIPFSLSHLEPSFENVESISNNLRVGFPPLPPADDEEYVSLCVAIKDQPQDLDEFLVHYYYHHGIRRRHTWMGFVDADEFLEMRREVTLVNWLHQWEDTEHVGALSVNWITRKSGGLQKQPSNDTRKGFRRCVVDKPDDRNAEGENAHVKTFVKTALFAGVNNVHHMRTADDTVSVGEKGDQCEIKRYPITHDTWELHHYSVKSREQFLEKQQRGSPNNHHAADEFWDKIEGADDYECPELAAYVP